MTLTLFLRIVAVGIAMLFAIQGFAMLGIGANALAVAWRVVGGAGVTLLLLRRRYWLRALVGMLTMAGAVGFGWILERNL